MNAKLSLDIETEMKRFKIFSDLSDLNRKYIAGHSVLKNLKKSEYLWHRNDPGDFCAVILEGLVEVCSSSTRGDDRLIGVFGPGEMIGLSAILKRTTFPADAVIASKGARVMKLFIRSAETESKNLSELQTWLRELLLIHEQILRDKIMILGSGRLHTKLVEFFEHLRHRFSNSSSDRDFEIPIPFTKTQIAKYTEARVETVIRTLNKWERAGYLTMHENGLVFSRFDKLKNSEQLP